MDLWKLERKFFLRFLNIVIKNKLLARNNQTLYNIKERRRILYIECDIAYSLDSYVHNENMQIFMNDNAIG